MDPMNDGKGGGRNSGPVKSSLAVHLKICPCQFDLGAVYVTGVFIVV